MYRVVIVLAGLWGTAVSQCEPTVTTTSGTHAPTTVCSGDLIFAEEFDSINFQKWEHENTLSGGGNWEFQWYTNNRTNSFVNEGVLYIKPTLTADHLGYDALYSAPLDVNGGTPADVCTDATSDGCFRKGTAQNILNPVKSARLRTAHSFSFKYGSVVVRAKLPAGDWIWPAIWMMPRYNVYGKWPASGEIDILEGRGNRDYVLNDEQIGTQLISSNLHWGPDSLHNGFLKTHFKKSNPAGFDSDFHVYETKWTPTGIYFYVDSEYTGGIAPPEGGFWELGEWGDSLFNPWKGNIMAPFDQEFYIIINNAVGCACGYFPNEAVNANGNPWTNDSPQALTDFWENRTMWLSSWDLEGSDSALQIDYIHVYAL